MLNVYCIYWGDKYPSHYVEGLARMVRRNLAYPHRFYCISNHEFTEAETQGVEVIPQVCPYPGWWQKVGLFKPGFATGPSLFLDLDVIICGDMTPMVEQYIDKDLAMIRDWSSGGYATVCTFWNPSPITDKIWDKFKPEFMDQVHGDQDYVHHVVTGKPLRTIPGGSHVNDAAPGVTEITPGFVVSYKRHCQNGPPKHACVVAFHGKPDWHEVNAEWIGRCRF